MTYVLPLFASVGNLQAFIEDTSVDLGYNTAAPADNHKGKLSHWAKALATLAYFNDKSSNSAIKTLRENRGVLMHLSFSFLIEQPAQDGSNPGSIFNIAERIGLSTLTSENRELIVLTGNLYEWRQAIYDGCIDKRTRETFNQILKIFDSIGLGDNWSDFRRKSLPDKTFLLEHKK